MEKLKLNWNLDELEGDFEKERKDILDHVENFSKKWKNRGDYLENPGILKSALDEYGEVSSKISGKEYYYFWLKNKLDQNNSEIKARFLDTENFSKNIENEISFFVLNISKIPIEKQNEFLSYEGLEEYRNFIRRIFETAKYKLSEKEEKIMNLKSTGSYSMWKNMLSSFLSNEEVEVLDENEEVSTKNFSELFGLICSKNKKVRDSAAKELNKIFEKHLDSAEAEINAVLLDKKINDELRYYERPDKSRHVSDDIESETVDSLIESVSEKFHLSKKFYELKSKLLGLEKLQYHERNVPYGEIKEEYNYEDSLELIYNTFKNLDEDFAYILRKFSEQGKIDVYPKKGKSSGAFCVCMSKYHPVYVLLNHTNKLSDVTTIAHEFGHAINDELMKKQNSLNFGTPLSTAEVASTFLEDFVIEELMKKADEETKLVLMMEKLNSDISSIMRQISCYIFEQELHKKFREKNYLSKKEIGTLFKKHMKNYMGDFVEQSEGSENWWVYWGHIRRYFYNYSYASGLIISKSLQKKVKENPKFIKEVKEFFSTGLSKPPKEIFLEMGIDISKKEFWQEGINEIENLLDKTEKLAKKLEKI